MKIVHLQTRLEAVFGVSDDDGDVVERRPITLDLPKHDEKTMAEVLRILKETREKLTADLNKAPEAPAETPVEAPKA